MIQRRYNIAFCFGINFIINIHAFCQEKLTLAINTNNTYQKIDGFGSFNTLSAWKNESYGNKYKQVVNDLGLTIMRFELPPTFHEYKDGGYNLKASVFSGPDLEQNFKDVRALNKLGVKKFIATVWSPPAWMKTLNTEGKGPTTNNGGILREDAYLDFASYCLAYCKAFKQQTGVDLYAIGLQNEPEFSEPYNSCLYNPQQMREALRYVGRLFRKENISTKIYVPEALPAQNHLSDYFNAINEDEETKNYADIFAIHNYDVDGINVGGAGSKEWANYAKLAASIPPAKQVWMTETSGHPNNWTGAMLLAANIYNGLKYGNLSAWVWWALADQKSSEQFALIVDGKPTSRYYVSKQFYKFIRPGAIRVESTTGNDSVLSLAFVNSGAYNTVVLIINKGSKDRELTLPVLIGEREIYMSSERLNCALEKKSASSTIKIPAQTVSTVVWK